MSPPKLLAETAELPIGRNILAVKPGRRRLVIVCGGQSGVDRAALDAACALLLPYRGWCPDKRWAEDGLIAPLHPMQECGSLTPAVRTELNTIDSDATLVLSKGEPQDGTPLTIERAQHHGKPTFVMALGESPDIEGFWRWIAEHDIRILNIGGPRESFSPGDIYPAARAILDSILDPTR
jgi:hypothetical protein